MGMSFRTVIESLLPAGSAWFVKSGGDLDKLIEGVGASLDDIRDFLADFARVRDPGQTPILADLEREYGIIPDPNLTEEQRRDLLNGVVYAAPGFGADYLQAKLRAAGFDDIFVYQNEGPAVNPAFYVEGTYAAWCGGEDSFCGSATAYCGFDSGGGQLLINDRPDDATTGIPDDATLCHLVFFVGGEKVAPAGGWFLIADGDMEDTDTAEWTEGNSAALTKDYTYFVSSTKSLKIYPSLAEA